MKNTYNVKRACKNQNGELSCKEMVRAQRRKMKHVRKQAEKTIFTKIHLSPLKMLLVEQHPEHVNSEKEQRL